MTLPRLLFCLLLPLLALASPGLAPVAGAQTARPASTLTAADIERLTSLLEDEARRAEFLRTLEALATASSAQAGAVGEGTAPTPLPVQVQMRGPAAAPAGHGGAPAAEGAEA
ncbi:hypothetical protein JYK14_25945, partial [Siccirubricoccus sp. KC 17139]|nr:hypothetical protein [Siccirubricoccus soli]MCP2685716.1 hypothetical protein [Siccirubricoccus soli]